MAPADVFTTVAFIGALLCFVTIIPFTPLHSAVLKIAPTLCVSCIESKINIKGFDDDFALPAGSRILKLYHPKSEIYKPVLLLQFLARSYFE